MLARAPDAPAPYLGVARSVRGLVWKERLAPEELRTAQAITQAHDLPEMLGRILAARGVAFDGVADMLAPTLRALMPDPASLAGMAAAAERIAQAIVGREAVAIFGDYDVDGACSAALVARFLRAHGVAATIYIPDRLFEGYGPNIPAIDTLIDGGAKLIVTVDCGATSHAPLAHAAARGVDVVVIDHHGMTGEPPVAAALVNPNRPDCTSGQGHLCAAGVAFLVLAAVAKRLREPGETPAFDLLGALDLVALATVADVVPLKGFNRAAVVQGLKIMAARGSTGLAALMEAAGLKGEPSAYACGFVLGPRINAGGRIGNAALGAELLSCDDAGRAAEIAALLDRLNRERQTMETAALAQAQAMAEARLDAEPDAPVLVVGSADFHKGLVGLVAARLTERFRRPTFVFAFDESGEATASARSIGGCDIGHAVRDALALGLALKGGGHAMAAGVTLAAGALPAFETYLAAALGGAVTCARETASLAIDGALVPSGATPELVAMLERVGPYGMGHPAPRFVFPAHRLAGVKTVGNAHVKARLVAAGGQGLEAIAFRAVGSELGAALLAGEGHVFHVAGRLTRDDWNGRTRVQVMIEDIADPARCG